MRKDLLDKQRNQWKYKAEEFDLQVKVNAINNVNEGKSEELSILKE